MKSDFNNAKVGDKVWCISLGMCHITSIDVSGVYPIRVSNTARSELFTLDGKSHTGDKFPSLFYEKPFCFKQKVKKAVELEGWYDIDNKKFRLGRLCAAMVEAKATITYEVME